jgi:hypothetical protein
MALTNAEYIAARGTRCPACGSTDTVGQEVVVDAAGAYQMARCQKCDASWNDIYTLAGYTDLDVGDESQQKQAIADEPVCETHRVEAHAILFVTVDIWGPKEDGVEELLTNMQLGLEGMVGLGLINVHTPELRNKVRLELIGWETLAEQIGCEVGTDRAGVERTLAALDKVGYMAPIRDEQEG